MVDKRPRSESTSPSSSISSISLSSPFSTSNVGKILSSFQQNQLSRLSLSGVPESAVPLEKNASDPSARAIAASRNVTAAHHDREKLPKVTAPSHKRLKISTAVSAERSDQAMWEADIQSELKTQELSGEPGAINKSSNDIQSRLEESSNNNATSPEKTGASENTVPTPVPRMQEQPKKNKQNTQTTVTHPTSSVLYQPNPSKKTKGRKNAPRNQQPNAAGKNIRNQPKAGNKSKRGKQANTNQQQSSSSQSGRTKGQQNNVTQASPNSANTKTKQNRMLQTDPMLLRNVDTTKMGQNKESLTMERAFVMGTVCKQLNEVIQKQGEMSEADEKRARLLISIHNEMREAGDVDPKL